MIADLFYRSGRFRIPAILVWYIAGCGIAYVNSVVNASPLLSSLVMILPPITINIIMSISGRFICRFFPLTWSHFYRTLLVQAIFCLLSVTVFFFVWLTYANMLFLLASSFFNKDFFYHSVPFVLPIIALINLLFILVHYIILFIEKNRIATEELLKQKLSLAEAEVNALKNTIHPHFLFNSLSMLQSLITQSPQKASEALASLSEYLLFSVQFGKKNIVTLDEEITHAKSYCAIELLRRNNSFTVNWDIGSECGELMIIPFVIQPLIENAIKHGVETMENGCGVSISIVKDNQKIIISVANNIGPIPASVRGSGTGLNTLNRRIDAAYGNSGKLLFEKHDDMFKAAISVPVKRSTNVVY